MSLTAGQVLENRYRIDALLGQGGMGAVYRSTDLRFNAIVAIKENRMVTAESQKQFAREAGLLYRLRHPHLPRVIDHFSIPYQGQYLVMDFVEGEDLKQVLSRHGSVPQSQALDWMSQVLDALEYLHGENIIHRDVKPANVKITPRGTAFLVDFGLAKVYDPQQHTTLGARGVTPGYAPPEQYGEGRTDARSDIYSAAATLYALLTGQTPPDALAFMIREVRFPRPRELDPRISPHIEAAILQAMQPAPEDRFQAVGDLREALLEPQTRQPGVDVADAPGPKAPIPEPETAASPAAPVTPPTSSHIRAPDGAKEPQPKEAMDRDSVAPAPAAPEVESSPVSWKRVAILALVAGVMNAASGLLGFDPMGFIAVGLVVLGLLAYHASRVPLGTQRQYQVEILSMWLCVAIAYLIVNEDDLSAVLLGTTVLFWLPSAILGAVVMWLVRRRASRKDQ
jgi:serine/threonine protein kinase